MTTLLEKLRVLAETEKQATAGPWEAHPQMSGYATVWAKGRYQLLNIDAKLSASDAALIADSRTLLTELLESWFAQNDALEAVNRNPATSALWIHKTTEALNLATTPHP